MTLDRNRAEILSCAGLSKRSGNCRGWVRERARGFSMLRASVFALLVLGSVLEADAQDALTLGPRAEDGQAVEDWIAERVRRAREGHRDQVRLPMTFKSSGWGCSCPDNYVGVDANSHTGEQTWMRFVNLSGAQLPAMPQRQNDDGAGGHYSEQLGMVVRVDGYFTGDVESVDYDGESYNVSVFRITQIHNRMRRPDNARVALLGTTEVGVCERVVHDDSPLNVRLRPRSRASVVGTLPNGTRLRPVEWRGHRWIRIEGEVAGWVWVDNTRRGCDPAPAPRP